MSLKHNAWRNTRSWHLPVHTTNIDFFLFLNGNFNNNSTEGKKNIRIFFFSIVTDIKIWNLISHRRLEIAVCQVNIWARNTQNNQERERKIYEWKQTWRKTWKNISTTRSSSKKKKKYTKTKCLRRYVKPYVEPTIGTHCSGHKNQLNIQFLL